MLLAMRRSGGFTMVEVLVASMVALLFFGGAWATLRGLTRSQVAADQRSTRALLEAQLQETLFRDLRSLAGEVVATGQPGRKTWTLERSMPTADGLELVWIEWTQLDDHRIERIEDAKGARRKQTFDFRGLLDPSRPKLDFAIEAVDDLVAVPADPPPGGAAR
jgi:type II secretory pathway component PulJ